MLLWYAARGAGLAALVLLAVAVAGGAVQSLRRVDPARRVVLQYVHRAAAASGLGLVALHVVAIVADPYAGVSVLGALVPGTSGYRPWQVALGTVALYGFVLVAGAGAARRSLVRSERATARWRLLHLLAYPCFAIAVGHGLTAGTDASRPWVIALVVALCALVAGALAARLTERRPALFPVRSRLPEVAR